MRTNGHHRTPTPDQQAKAEARRAQSIAPPAPLRFDDPSAWIVMLPPKAWRGIKLTGPVFEDGWTWATRLVARDAKRYAKDHPMPPLTEAQTRWVACQNGPLTPVRIGSANHWASYTVAKAQLEGLAIRPHVCTWGSGRTEVRYTVNWSVPYGHPDRQLAKHVITRVCLCGATREDPIETPEEVAA